MMRAQTLIVIILVLAIGLWAGMLYFMNNEPPTTFNQTIFLLILGATVSCSVIPISYAFHARFSFLPSTQQLNRAVRQGLLAGVLGTVLMALRFLRLLNPLTAVILILFAVTSEVVLSLKNR
jgi:membrane protein YdbS with pleckstrin-like domain